MSPLFDFGGKKRERTRVIRHMQTQYALQQLAMETYNDALESVGYSSVGDEVTSRVFVQLGDPALVSEYALPAATQKIEIIRGMQGEHKKFQTANVPPNALKVLEFWTEVLAILLQRAEIQQAALQDWVDSENDVSVSITAMDSVETLAMTKSVEDLNELISSAGLTGEPWLKINWEAMNDVRSRVGLSPLSFPEWEARFLEGIAGGRARFYER